MTSCLGIDIGIRNLSFCVLRRELDGTYTIPVWELVSVMDMCGMGNESFKKLTSGQIHDMAHFVIPKLFPLDFIHKHTVAHVSIEQQPHGKYGNPKIVLFSHLLFEYFQSNLWAITRHSSLETVSFTGASQKYLRKWLTQYNLEPGRTYAQRKHLSIVLCINWCCQLGIPTTQLDEHKKSDDLADAFLLAWVVLEKWL